MIGIEEKPNNMVIRDNRLQNPSEVGNKRPSASQIQD